MLKLNIMHQQKILKRGKGSIVSSFKKPVNKI